MSATEELRASLAAKFEAIFPHLDERQRRLLMGTEARAIGHGGIRLVARAAGIREATVSLGVSELDSGQVPLGRVRRPGGGRKRVVDLDPELRAALLALVEPDMRGDPMSPLRWTTKSTRNLATELTRQGHRVCADVVGDLLREEGFSLQGNAKTIEGKQHADRDGQFRYINEQARVFQQAGDPVISVDRRKKELIGPYKNAGRQWRPKGDPVRVGTHDFPDRELGKAVPYGIYDLAANTGWVNVGTDHDTAAFAVESIRRWWNGAGHNDYPQAGRLLITADAGGSNSYRTRAWKTELAVLAAETGLPITECHLPPGTSKWNRIEHRLFRHITMNWRNAEPDTGHYPTGVEISDTTMTAQPITRHDFHGDWNHTLGPTSNQAPGPQDALGPETDGPASIGLLSHPALTGMSRHELAAMTAQLAAAQAAQHKRQRHTQRGTERRRAPGAGPRAKLTDADRVMATVLYLRKLRTQAVLGELFAEDRGTITRAIQETHPLLEQHGYAIAPSTSRFPAPADLIAFLARTTEAPTEIKPAC